MKETVPVTVAEREVRGFNEEYEPTLFGKVISRVYEGERVQRHFFQAQDSGKEYRLGPTTTAFNFVDHVEALDPLLNEGWKIKDMKLMKGGLKLFSILVPENPTELVDPITWDQDVWGVSTAPLLEAVMVVSSIAPGHGINYSFGWFRMICTNGLVSELFGFGSGKFSHSNWSRSSLDGFLKENRLNGGSVNPVLGSKKGLDHASQIIDVIAKDPQDQIQSLAPIRKTLAPLAKLPQWYMADLQDQFNMIQSEKPSDEVTALDLLNAVTSPINMEREAGKDRDRMLFKTERIVYPLAQLVAFMSLGVIK